MTPGARAHGPVILEVALSGFPSKPNVPNSPDDIARDALACFQAGAAIVHNHIEDFKLAGETAAARYYQGWERVLRERPDAILYPTLTLGGDDTERLTHIPPLAARGAIKMAAFDPGSTNFAAADERGLPSGREFVYVNSYVAIDKAFELLRAHKIGASLAIYEPSFLRATLAYHHAGLLPAGSFVKFYFGGEYNLLSGRRGNLSFGLPPTRKALDAYLEMLEGTNLPWAVAVLGGDVVKCGMARMGLERGGHLRVGLEDYSGEAAPTNLQLVEAAVDLCKSVGRPLATIAETRAILGLQ